jgi:cleavage and polyadenylation specificity factor subunit 3
LPLQVRLALEMMFEGTQGTGDLGRVNATSSPTGKGQVLRIGDAVTLTYQPPEPGSGSSGGQAILEWCGGSDADMVADAAVAVVLQAAGQPPGLPAIEVLRHKALAAGDSEAAERAELGIVTALLGAQFGPARVDADQVRVAGRQQCLLSGQGCSPSSQACAQILCPAATVIFEIGTSTW